MRKLITLAIFLAVAAAGMAQDIDNFEVGPYEVEYKGSGDYKFRLRKGVDLYKYYGLKRDTIVRKARPESQPVEGAMQVDVFMALPRYVANGTSNVFGVEGQWKQAIGRNVYFNGGLSLGLSFGKYGEYWKSLYPKDWKEKDGQFSETMFEVGVPLSVEFASLNRKKASMYLGVGVVPTLYFGGKGRSGGTDSEGKAIDDGSASGLFVAPRLDIGGYLPVGGQLVRVGGFVQYDINCSKGDFDIFGERVGRVFLGANIGLIL